MTVKIRPYRKGGWEVDIRVVLPDGSKLRERRKAPVRSKSAARRWGEARERHLIQHGRRKAPEEIPTLGEFWDRFIEGHCRANHHKPSGIESKQTAYRAHLGPLFADTKLDRITAEDIARIKRRLADRRPSTVNNTLSALSMALRVAVEWGVIDRAPASIRQVRNQKPAIRFYDFDEYERLVEAARRVDERALLLVLLGGDAGLRRGEMIALDWPSVDLRRGRVTIERSEVAGKLSETKGMEHRVVPLTGRLHAALTAHRHLRGDRVLYRDGGASMTAKTVRRLLARAQRRAGLRDHGGTHVLRHTFCSHLAMRGAPAITIQRLAGHKNLQTTLRYMHLAEGETDRAIRLLEAPAPADRIVTVGDRLETARPLGIKSSHSG